jgi:hypothetical protein
MSTDRPMTPAEQRRYSEELDKLERDVAELEVSTRLLLTSALLRDGHAATWQEAALLARDLPAVRELYGIES